MSGHSKWHSIKHKKAAVDAKRGKMFTKVIKELMIAARMGGSDLNGNPRLRAAILAAKDVNMPKDTMDRAIKRGAGELEGQSFEEIVYEGYGPGGAAVMVKVTTDNRNRAASEVRHAFSKYGGNLGETGCVGWQFKQCGQIVVTEGAEDQLMELALEAGADDLVAEDDAFLIRTAPSALMDVREALEAKGVKVDSSEVTMIPSTTVKLEGKDAENMIKLATAMEEHDDVDAVYANFDIDASLLEQLSR
jgi:YebC/PmpR family DNA-binding regulatory protein